MAWKKVANLSPTGGIQPPAPYVRPADWLPLPAVANGEEKVVGLYAVWNHDGNYATVRAGYAYTVNWGDGTVESFAAGVVGAHIYDYSAIPASTLSTRGYRQVIVTVTPQGATPLGGVDLYVRHPAITSISVTYSNGWLDVRGSGAGNRLVVGDIIGGPSKCTQLEQYEYLGTPTQLPGATFVDCYSLQSILVDPSFFSKTTSFLVMFKNCYSIRSFAEINFPTNVTSFTSTFSGCYSLEALPATLDFSKVTAMSSMFYGCRSLKKALPINAPLCTDASALFQGCSSLQAVPTIDIPLNATCANMFDGCATLTYMPQFDTSNVTNFGYMFSGCASLPEVPMFNTSKGTTFVRMFQNCSVLNRVPTIDTALGTDFSYMFLSCSSIVVCPPIDTSKGTTFSNMFNGCNALMTIPALDMSKATAAFSSIFSGCSSLTTMLATGINKTVTFAQCRLSATALNTVYSNLATIGGQTITVTGNVGTTGDDPSIATAKGWTVTGS